MQKFETAFFAFASTAPILADRFGSRAPKQSYASWDMQRTLTHGDSGPSLSSGLQGSDAAVHPWDALCYYGYRYYNPQLGRWPSRDPIEERGGLNLYAFALTDPISQTDYLGLTVYPGQSNCLGYGFTGRKGVCVWPEEGQSMKKYLKSDPSSKGCKAINNTGQCDCRGQISVILVFYTPEKYVGDPWESPQNWESTPGIDVHVMRKGCNSKDWTEVSSGTTTTEDTIVRTVDPGKWDGAGFKMVCCCQKCFTFYFHHELSTSASICENRSYII